MIDFIKHLLHVVIGHHFSCSLCRWQKPFQWDSSLKKIINTSQIPEGMIIHWRVRNFSDLSTNYPSKYLQITGNRTLQLVEWSDCGVTASLLLWNHLWITFYTFWPLYLRLTFIAGATNVGFPFKAESQQCPMGHHQHASSTSSSSGFSLPEVENVLKFMQSCCLKPWTPAVLGIKQKSFMCNRLYMWGLSYNIDEIKGSSWLIFKL